MNRSVGVAHHDRWEEGAWPVQHHRDAPLEWLPDPDGDTIQGPLDLCFVAGRNVLISLAPHEAALLARRGRLARVMLSGQHWLAVGGEDCPADGLLYFLRLDQPLAVEWRQYLPVPRHDTDEPATRLHAGRFLLTVEQPVRFYDSLLSNRRGEGDEICLPTLRHLLPTLLTIRLSGMEPPAAGRLGTLLSHLKPSLLDPDLAPYGLRCRAWSIREPGETRSGGRSPAVAVPSGALP